MKNDNDEVDDVDDADHDDNKTGNHINSNSISNATYNHNNNIYG